MGCQLRYNTYERIDDPMKCPFCHDSNNRLVESSDAEGGYAVHRRRECLNCRREFSTFERSEERTIKVIKKDGVRAPFDRRKIKHGLERACWKRPISDEQIEQIVSSIEMQVRSVFDVEVPAAYIGELVMRQLRDLDQVAFVRFASVYRRFEDARDFVEQVEPMLRDGLSEKPEPETKPASRSTGNRRVDH